MWHIELVDGLYVIRYKPSMIILFMTKDEMKYFVKFILELDINELKIEEPYYNLNGLYGLKLGLLDNGHRIVELYSYEKGVAFVIFIEYLIELINLIKEEYSEMG